MTERVHLQHGIDLHNQTFHEERIDVRNLGRARVNHTARAGTVVHFPLVHREPRSIKLRIELDLGIDLLTGNRDILPRIHARTLWTTVQDAFRHASATQEGIGYARDPKLLKKGSTHEEVVENNVLTDSL